MLREGMAKTSNEMRAVFFFRHDDLPDIELYACKRYCHITEEGAEPDLFEVAQEIARAEGTNEDENFLVPQVTTDADGDTANFLALGVTVDDDTMPVPDNIPSPETDSSDNVVYGEWDGSVLCNRATRVGRNESLPSLVNQPQGSSLVQWFMYFLPWAFFTDVIIPQTNNRICGESITEGEFMRFIGLWLLFSTVHTGQSKRSFWSGENPNPFFGAPFRCNEYMTLSRFEAICSALKYTNRPRPSYKDKIHEVRQLLNAFNDLMEQIFVAGWVVCLDESMSPWTNMFTCPAFVFCPRKPYPKGNEYHTIADGLSGILFKLEMVEGQDEPPETFKEKNFQPLGKTTGLLLRLCTSLFGSSTVVILDSGFCVLKAIIELKKRGVYAAAVIKKRRYWPKHVKGDEIKAAKVQQPLGTQSRLPGKYDNIPFDLFTSNEPDYVQIFTSTYGTINPKVN